MLPLSPRHTPVILMGAAILSDGITAASRCIPSVVMGAILEPGEKKKRFPNPPYIGLRPIYLKKKKNCLAADHKPMGEEETKERQTSHSESSNPGTAETGGA